MNAAEIKKAITRAIKDAAACWDNLSGAGKFDRAKADGIGARLFRELEPALRPEGPDLAADPNRIELHPEGCEVTVKFPSGDVCPPIKAARLQTYEVAPGVKVLVLGASSEDDPAFELFVGTLPKAP